jgi:outer membrane protein OmpA-like peptidoglycan-associated protein
LLAQNLDEPKVEVFGGYSWYRSGSTVNSVSVPNFSAGWASQFIFNRRQQPTGIVVEVDGHYNDFGDAHALAFGPRVQMHVRQYMPFVESLIGVQHTSAKNSSSQTSGEYIIGGGFDMTVNPRFSVRPLQIDYVGTSFGSGAAANGLRVQGGVVYYLGVPEEEGVVTASCSAEPAAVDSGAMVRIGVTAKGFVPKRRLRYSYVTTGGAIVPNAATASVDTTGLGPGKYTVSAKVVDNGKRNHQQRASCQTAFGVNAKHPPVLTASANAATVRPGGSLTITASGSSEDKRPLSYSCSASAGQLTGNGPTFTLDTTGVPKGKVTVDCTVTDDRNLSASSSTTVDVEPSVQHGPVSMPPQPSKFGAIEFKHDLKRPTRVDNEAKGELDRYADALAATPDANSVVVGYGATEEDKDSQKVINFAGQRAVNTKDYLSKGKGVDPARIQPRIGKGDEQKAELWIVPAGAKFAAAGTTVVDESKVHAVPRVTLKARKTGKAHRTVHKKKHTSR